MSIEHPILPKLREMRPDLFTNDKRIISPEPKDTSDIEGVELPNSNQIKEPIKKIPKKQSLVPSQSNADVKPNSSKILFESNSNNLIKFEEVSHYLDDGWYDLTITRYNFAEKNGKKYIYFVYSCEFDNNEIVEIYKYYELILRQGSYLFNFLKDIRMLPARGEYFNPEVLVGRDFNVKIQNSVGNGKNYSNIVKAEIYEEEIDDYNKFNPGDIFDDQVADDTQNEF